MPAIAFGLGGFLGTVASDLARYLSGSAAVGYGVVFAGEAALFAVEAGKPVGVIHIHDLLRAGVA